MTSGKRTTIEAFLTYFEQKGIETGYFEVAKIKELHKTCCHNATTEVIDFDKTNKKLVAEAKLFTPKSCDCLKIRPKNKSIDLIEMKGFAHMLNNFNKEKVDEKEKEIDEKINKSIENFNLLTKIEDSINLLNMLVIKKEFERTLDDVKSYRDTQLNFIVLTDTDTLLDSGFKYFVFANYFLSHYSDSIENYIGNQLNTELSNIPQINYKLNKPTLKTCSEIDAYLL